MIDSVQHSLGGEVRPLLFGSSSSDAESEADQMRVRGITSFDADSKADDRLWGENFFRVRGGDGAARSMELVSDRATHFPRCRRSTLRSDREEIWSEGFFEVGLDISLPSIERQRVAGKVEKFLANSSKSGRTSKRCRVDPLPSMRTRRRAIDFRKKFPESVSMSLGPVEGAMKSLSPIDDGLTSEVMRSMMGRCR